MNRGAEETVAHGGNLTQARRRYPDAPLPWLDLSTGINPVPYPLPHIDTGAWTRLPQPDREQALLSAAARRYGVPDSETIVAAPGTQALIQTLPRLRPPGTVAVVGPTYAEHAVSWRREGHRVETFADLGLAEAALPDVIVVVNPDNPTGRLLEVERLAATAGRLHRRRGLLVVDEAFVDALTADASSAGKMPSSTVVLRSFGKFYGLAGLRLGFAVAQPSSLAAALRRRMGPWAVAGPAIDIGEAALADDDWYSSTHDRLAADAARLDRLLTGIGARIEGGTPLFRLAAFDGAASALAEHLAHAGILVRSFKHRRDWLRFGLPGSSPDWRRLEIALEAYRA